MKTESIDQNGRLIIINGIVQGVGFRPAVYRYAQEAALCGDVRNSTRGVIIRVFGAAPRIDQFIQNLTQHLPAMARVDSIEQQTIPWRTADGFSIIESEDSGSSFLPVSPDLATCSACRAEILDPSNRRCQYPFTNCTHCGPRFTILNTIPYDRKNTSMSGFKLCEACVAEYHDPADRRFHAQPTACADCGPKVRLLQPGKADSCGTEALRTAADALSQGRILALKGLGGYHLACDAGNAAAVALLRERKHRSGKPFALMARNLAAAEAAASISADEARLLASPEAPILILEKRPNCPLPTAVAPNQNTLGIMLPYTPLHILLFEKTSLDLLVMTSANFSEEPLIYEDSQSDFEKLWQLSDLILTHDRPIVNRIDDSVVRWLPTQSAAIPLRRARGYAPKAALTSEAQVEVLAVGADLKNTFCLTREHYRVLSHHIGDIENLETLEAFTRAVDHYEKLFRCHPRAIGCDLHPNFHTTRYAEQRSQNKSLPLFRIQHHYAHIASVLADRDRFDECEVIGLALDGTGYGPDGTIWGGEALICSSHGFVRAYHLEPFLIPASDETIRNPAIQALAILRACQIPWSAAPAALQAHLQASTGFIPMLETQLSSGTNCVRTSSIGRLFDAVSAILGVCFETTYEGQAAIELETISLAADEHAYHFTLGEKTFSAQPVIEAILADLQAGVPVPVIGGRFHQAIIQICLEICIKIRETTFAGTEPPPVVLSGGVWQNRILLNGTCERLQNHGFEVLLPQSIPFNDGCIAVGQTAIVHALLKEG